MKYVRLLSTQTFWMNFYISFYHNNYVSASCIFNQNSMGVKELTITTDILFCNEKKTISAVWIVIASVFLDYKLNSGSLIVLRFNFLKKLLRQCTCSTIKNLEDFTELITRLTSLQSNTDSNYWKNCWYPLYVRGVIWKRSRITFQGRIKFNSKASYQVCWSFWRDCKIKTFT